MWIRPIFLSEPARVWQNSDRARQPFKYIVQTHRSPTESMSQLFILMTRFFMNILQTVSQTYSCWLWTNITEEVRRYEHIYNPSLNTYKDVQMTAKFMGRIGYYPICRRLHLHNNRGIFVKCRKRYCSDLFPFPYWIFCLESRFVSTYRDISDDRTVEMNAWIGGLKMRREGCPQIHINCNILPSQRLLSDDSYVVCHCVDIQL